jgi:hypothetical protein
VKSASPTLWRQGDVFVVAVEKIPAGRRESHSLVLAKGEITGHTHRIAESGRATAFKVGDRLILEVSGENATLIHEEHAPITLPRGTYEIRLQREYAPTEIRRVVD